VCAAQKCVETILPRMRLLVALCHNDTMPSSGGSSSSSNTGSMTASGATSTPSSATGGGTSSSVSSANSAGGSGSSGAGASASAAGGGNASGDGAHAAASAVDAGDLARQLRIADYLPFSFAPNSIGTTATGTALTMGGVTTQHVLLLFDVLQKARDVYVLRNSCEALCAVLNQLSSHLAAFGPSDAGRQVHYCREVVLSC
jgi:hypothetical protein